MASSFGHLNARTHPGSWDATSALEKVNSGCAPRKADPNLAAMEVSLYGAERDTVDARGPRRLSIQIVVENLPSQSCARAHFHSWSHPIASSYAAPLASKLHTSLARIVKTAMSVGESCSFAAWAIEMKWFLEEHREAMKLLILMKLRIRKTASTERVASMTLAARSAVMSTNSSRRLSISKKQIVV